MDKSAIRNAAAQAVTAHVCRGIPHKYLFRGGVDTWAMAYDGAAVSPPLKNTKVLHYPAFCSHTLVRSSMLSRWFTKYRGHPAIPMRRTRR